MSFVEPMLLDLPKASLDTEAFYGYTSIYEYFAFNYSQWTRKMI